MYKERVNYDLFIILKRIVCQFHLSLAMKLVDSRARQIERVGCVGRVPAHSRAIARVALKCLENRILILEKLLYPHIYYFLIRTSKIEVQSGSYQRNPYLCKLSHPSKTLVCIHICMNQECLCISGHFLCT